MITEGDALEKALAARGNAPRKKLSTKTHEIRARNGDLVKVSGYARAKAIKAFCKFPLTMTLDASVVRLLLLISV